MTLDHLTGLLAALSRSQRVAVPYATYAGLFPPGEPSPQSRNKCVDYASANDCFIQNRIKQHTIWFVKNA